MVAEDDIGNPRLPGQAGEEAVPRLAGGGLDRHAIGLRQAGDIGSSDLVGEAKVGGQGPDEVPVGVGFRPA